MKSHDNTDVPVCYENEIKAAFDSFDLNALIRITYNMVQHKVANFLSVSFGDGGGGNLKCMSEEYRNDAYMYIAISFSSVRLDSLSKEVINRLHIYVQ